MAVLKVIQELLSTPSILVGLMALIGLCLQKKPVEDVVKGTIKTIVGFLVLSAGSSFLQTGSLNDFGTLFNFAFNVQGVVPNNEAIVTAGLVEYAGPTALIMCFGMLANIVMARFSRWNYIFLTGHHTLYMACLIAVVLSVGGLTGAPLVIGGSLILGLVMALFPAIAQKTMTKITGTEDIGFGHFSTIGYWFAAQVGKLTSSKARKEGRTVKSTEDINFPQRVSFMRDNTVAISITMMVLFLIVTGVASTKSGFADLDTNYVSGGYTNWFTYALVTGMNFAGGIVGMFILFGIKGAALAAVPIILPGVVPHFFCGATAGVFANAEGGLKGCIVGAFFHGLLITFLPVFCMPVLGALHYAGTTFSDADFCGVGIILGNIARFTTGNLLLIVCVILFLIPIIYNFVAKKPAAKAE